MGFVFGVYYIVEWRCLVYGYVYLEYGVFCEILFENE